MSGAQSGRKAGSIGTLYLLPALLSGTSAQAALPEATLGVARSTSYFLAENAKSARAFLKAVGHPQAIASLDVIEIGHAPDPRELDRWLEPLLKQGRDGAIVSEAGCPGVADPGAELVARAHALGIRVRPLVGPSAILLALMGSGLDGQRFRFVGYLPQDRSACAQAIRELEFASAANAETQVFIETPYRNDRLFEGLLSTCDPGTRLLVAVDLTGTQEMVCTRTIAQWRSLDPVERPELRRRPCVFALMAATSARPRR
jgi:16S rRNA (cytidine1402-2'-O)-methyltransferase